MATKRSFARVANQALLDALAAEKLFAERLRPDVLHKDWKRRVFPALRRGRIDFYHGGGKLFSFDSRGFTTHLKYASVLDGVRKAYVSEADLAGATVVGNFCDAYEQIKANCGRYAGVEAKGVADVYQRSSHARCADDVVALDIEVSLGGEEAAWSEAPAQEGKRRGKGQNRVDLVLFHSKKRQLRFYEAKHWSNPELWSAKGKIPRVAAQLRRYNALLGNPTRRDEILTAYASHIDVMNRLFGTNMPEPEAVEEDAVLLVFGYDSSQQGRIRDLLESDGSLSGLRLRRRGSTSDTGCTARELWQRVTRC